MPTFAANLSFMFNEWDFLDRFQAAADAGFNAVEYLFPYEHAPEVIAKKLDDTGLAQALFNLPAGDWSMGERGVAALPDRFEQVKTGLERALPYIEATKVERVHLMAGIADWDDPEAMAAYRKSLSHVAGRLGEGRRHPDHRADQRHRHAGLLPRQRRQRRRPDRPGAPAEPQAPVRHLPLPDHPRRRDPPPAPPAADHRPRPDRQRAGPPRARWRGAQLPYLFQELDLLGYEGFVGCEYRPRGKTLAGLDWFTSAGGRSQ
ncbi:MAG: TIM barrel protein [Caulobacteraceae bacterium]